MLTEPEEVFVVARVYAEGSDWQRDKGESLVGWTSRALKRANAVPKLEAERKKLVEALRDCVVAFAEMDPKPEDYEAVNNAAVLLRDLGEA